jgi:fatty-acid desaturase
MTAPTADLLDDGPVTLGGDRQSWLERAALAAFIVVPFLALLVAIPVAWGGWLSWTDVVIALGMYAVTGHGITVGFHRLFTHKAFKPNRAVKVALAVAGSMAIQRPVIRDRSGNVWWLAIPSMGESWHNLHHADPTCARHGVLRGQLDTSARLIWALEKLGWVSDVRWPVQSRLDARRALSTT